MHINNLGLSIYVLGLYFRNKSKDRYYIGHCSDLEERLILQNMGNNISTKAYFTWEIVCIEEFKTKYEAMK